MKTLAFAYPGDLATPTGGYGYARRIINGLTGLGWSVEPVPLGPDYPAPSPQTRAQALEVLADIPHSTPLVIDGLAYGALPGEAAELARTHHLIALVHHPLALETGLTEAHRHDLAASERRALSMARTIIASSEATARELDANYGVDREFVAVVPPGTDPVPDVPAPRRAPKDPLRVLSVGSLVPRKGHDALIRALAEIGSDSGLDWRLEIAGDDRLDPHCAAALRGLVADLGLEDRVTLHGALSAEALETLYGEADVFALATRYEGYGMAFAEAVVRGLPVVASGGGAVPDTVPGKAGVVVADGDGPEFREGLSRMLKDADFRAACARGAREAAGDFPSWEDSAARFAAAVEGLL